MNKKIIFGTLAIVFLIGFSVQEGYSQYMGQESIEAELLWSDKVKQILQEYLEINFYHNPNIILESIKTRISGSGEDVSPPRYHVRILYDEIKNGKIIHMDSVYNVDFGPVARTPDNAKLEKIYEEKYLPPNQIKNTKFEEFPSYLTGMMQNIMCRQGFEKVVKESTKESLCVKTESIGKLVDRGWIKMDYSSLKILQNKKYDSLYLPISVTYVQPYSEFKDYSWISTKIWNLRNIPSDYSVEVFNPEGEQVKICSKPTADEPQKPHSVNEWKTLLNSCGHSRIPGNYTVIVSLDSKNETFIVNVPK
ncbi:MAG: hypothetical protein ACE5DL_03760 [Nitrosopumilaceae archaeon]